MREFALWQRLDTPGHDAAVLTGTGDGWSLRGVTAFNHAAGPAALNYSVDLDKSWNTLRGEVQGFIGERDVSHRIDRHPEGWQLNGIAVAGLKHLADLDYNFTPATNYQQLRRFSRAPGPTIEFPVAWLNVDDATLTELGQRYTRRDQASYWYEAASVPYEGLLEIAPNGFVQNYPGLWRMLGA